MTGGHDPRRSFITGALILIIANTISKILGAVLKVPLTYLLNEEGMSLYNTAFQAYAAVMSLSTAGFLFAGSKAVSERLALGDKGGVFKCITALVILLTVFGAAGGALLWLGSDFLAAALHEPASALGMRALAPSVLLVALGIAFKSYYQGASDMLPTALSQVTESAVKLIAGYMLALMFSYSLAQSAAGSLLGVTAGEALATAMLFLMYLPHRLKNRDKPAISIRSASGMIFSCAMPLLLISAASNALSLADTAIIRRMLVMSEFTQSSASVFKSVFPAFKSAYETIISHGRLNDAAAGQLYGAYTGYALTVFHLPVGITATFSVSALPLISGALATGEKQKALRHAETAMRMTVLFAVPAAVGTGVLSKELLDLLFKNSSSAPMLSLISPGILFIAVDGLAVSVLQMSGYAYSSFPVLILTYAVKFAANILLISVPELNILGAVIASDICFFVSMCVNLTLLRKKAGLKLRIKDILVKPVLCGGGMAAVMLLLRSRVYALAMPAAGTVAILGLAGAAAFFLFAALLTGSPKNASKP